MGLIAFNLHGVVDVNQAISCEESDGNVYPSGQYVPNSAEITSPMDDNVVRRRRLEFVHIPKTGGTAIESEAARHNVSWSICHFALPQAVVRISLGETVCPVDSLKFPWPRRKKYHQCPWWHLPPSYFRLQPENPYEGADLFAVVRNVYSRLISEYYYMGTYLRNYTERELNSVPNFNRWLARVLGHIHPNVGIKGQPRRNRTSRAAYFFDAGHYIPQYDYIYEHRERIVHHVLRFENLTAEFDELMEQYGLPFIRLPRRQVRQSHKKKLGVYNMTRQVLNWIEMIYEQDFLEWGYEVMSEKIPSQILDENQRVVNRALHAGKQITQGRTRNVLGTLGAILKNKTH